MAHTRNKINQQAVDIQKRFFDAIDALIATSELSGLKEFCEKHSLNRTKYSLLKNGCASNEDNNTYRTIDIDALSYLCTDFGVSAQWLLTGAGKMRTKRTL